MKIEVDEDKFDSFQVPLVTEIMESVRRVLEEGSLNAETVRDLTGNVAFSVCALLDQCQVIERDGKVIVPQLTFRDVQGADGLIVSEGGSWMHEYVFASVEDVFDGSKSEELKNSSAENPVGEGDKKISQVLSGDLPEELREMKSYDIDLKFESGVKVCLCLSNSFSRSSVESDVSDMLYDVIDLFEKDGISRSTKVPISEICPAFSRLLSICFYEVADEEVVKKYEGEHLMSKSISDLVDLITEFMPLREE